MAPRTMYLMGARVFEKLAAEIEVCVAGLETDGGPEVTDSYVNWSFYGLPLDPEDVPPGYDGGRWSLQYEGPEPPAAEGDA